MTVIHQSAQDGYSKYSAVYEAGRPGYPPELQSWLTRSGIRSGTTVVDLSAGTGKFTKLLVRAGADIIAIEPVGAMRGKISQNYPSVDTINGSATKMPLSDDSVDAVFCAQAFLWFATSEALEEIRRALKPNGMLGLIWNVRDETENG